MRYNIIKINKQEKQNTTKLSSHIGKEHIDQCPPHTAKGERVGRINRTVFRSKHRKVCAILQESLPSYSLQLTSQMICAVEENPTAPHREQVKTISSTDFCAWCDWICSNLGPGLSPPAPVSEDTPALLFQTMKGESIQIRMWLFFRK